MAESHPNKGRGVSARVQIFANDTFKDSAVQPLKAFRLRLNQDSTFADLARIAIARYAKDDPVKGRDARIGSILDEEDCAVDMDDEVDIIKDGEVLKLVLVAAASSAAVLSTPSNEAGSAANAPPTLPAQTPAVKNVRPRTPAILNSLAPRSSQPPGAAVRSTSQPKSSPPRPAPSSIGKRHSAVAVRKASQDKSVGGRRDPYEIPSDSEDFVATRKTPKQEPKPRQRVGPGSKTPVSAPDNVDRSRPRRKAPLPATQQPALPAKPNVIPPNVDFILISDSSSTSDDTDGSSLADHAAAAKAQPVNGHLNVVKGDSRGQAKFEEPEPAFIVKKSQGSVPILRRKETTVASGGRAKTPPASSAASIQTSRSAKSVGSLTLKPSRVAEAVKRLKAKFEREYEEQAAQRKQSIQEQAEYEESQRKAKAEAKSNLPSSAIAHVKRITTTKFGCRNPTPQIPSSFFQEPDHSDEDLGDIITGTQQSITEAEKLEGCRAPPNTVTSQHFTNVFKAISPTTKFKPINTLWPAQAPPPEPQPIKKFGAGYSLRVREVFSDSESSEDSDEGDSASETSQVGPGQESSTECDTGTPEPVRRWLATYETNFTPHVGFCSVADGPFKGLIRGGPDKGRYLKGHNPPTPQQIADMEKTAISKQYLNDWDTEESDSDSVDSKAVGSDAELDDLPTVVPCLLQTTPTTDLGVTSVFITRQLSQEAPPSNQELGIQMSSSPTRCTAGSAKTHIRRRSARLASTKTPAVSDSLSKPRSNNHMPLPDQGGQVIAETPERSSKFLQHDADLDVTPSFERALSQVETPSTRSRSVKESPMKNKETVRKGVQPARSGIVVNITKLSARKQAEYKKIPDPFEQDLLGAPLRSFEEINRCHEDSKGNTQDSGTAAIEHVLRDSPSWLSNMTEVKSPPSPSPRKAPYALRSQTGGSHGRVTLNLPKERKVDQTKDRDPTYQPSQRGSEIDDSGYSRIGDTRKSPKEHITTTPRRALSQHEPPVQVRLASLSSQVAALSPEAKKKRRLSANEPRLISTTPIPVPIIPNLLQGTRTNTKPDASQAAPVPEISYFSAPPRPQIQSEGLVSESRSSTTGPLAIIPAIAPVKITIDNDSKVNGQSGKRKRLDEDIACISKSTSHTERRRQKKQKNIRDAKKPENQELQDPKQLMDEEQECNHPPHHILPGSVGFNDVVSDQTRALFQTLESSNYISSHMNRGDVDSESKPGRLSVTGHHGDVTSTNDGPFSKKNKENRKRRRQNRKQNRARARHGNDGETVSSTQLLSRPNPTAHTAGKPGITRAMSKSEKKAFKRQVQGVKNSGYGQSPTIPPMFNLGPQSTLQESPAMMQTHQTSASPGTRNVKQHKKHVSKPVNKKFLSPPTTSRPSSAGSKM